MLEVVTKEGELPWLLVAFCVVLVGGACVHYRRFGMIELEVVLLEPTFQSCFVLYKREVDTNAFAHIVPRP